MPMFDSLSLSSQYSSPVTPLPFPEPCIPWERLMVECVSKAAATDYSTLGPLGRMTVNWHWTVNHGCLAFHYWKELTSAAGELQPRPARAQRKFVSLRDDLKWVNLCLYIKMTRLQLSVCRWHTCTCHYLVFPVFFCSFQLPLSHHWGLVSVSQHFFSFDTVIIQVITPYHAANISLWAYGVCVFI